MAKEASKFAARDIFRAITVIKLFFYIILQKKTQISIIDFKAWHALTFLGKRNPKCLAGVISIAHLHKDDQQT